MLRFSAAGFAELPDRFALSQNYPNPFNPSTRIGFALPVPAYVTLRVFNVLGQVVATLIGGELHQAGTAEAVFDAGGLPSGIYYYQLQATEVEGGASLFRATAKMIVLK